jgi:anti-anti-sigma regulatory factor
VRLDLVAGRLEVTGQLDHRTAHLVNDAISTLVHAGTQAWAVDVSELAGRDRDCLRVIGAAYRRALRHGRAMTLIGAPPHPRGPAPAPCPRPASGARRSRPGR